jgi:DNA-binding IclR family transcriptional regulator
MKSMSKTSAAKGSASVGAYATPALDKGLDILELLALQSEGLTKSQLARELNRTVSEIFRMLVCLERRGYIAQIGDDRYSLTLKMFKLAQEHPPTERLVVDALPLMKRLAHETMQSCHLATLDVDKIVILAQVNAATNLGFYVKPGSTVDLLESASGYVILAHSQPDERARILTLWRQKLGRKLPPGFDAHLRRICADGYERRASYVVKGIVNISYPVFDERGHAVAALTIPFVQTRDAIIPEKKVSLALSAAAVALSAAVGGKVSKPTRA